MRRLKRFAELTNVERLLLLRAFCIVAAARVALWSLPVKTARRAISIIAGVTLAAVYDTRTINSEVSVERFVWAVKVVSRCIPRATCLTQAVAIQPLLARAGHASRLEIGVAKDAGDFQAHAWVVCDGRVIIGGPDVTRYSRLMTLETSSIGVEA
jgi:hypothetical protein